MRAARLAMALAFVASGGAALAEEPSAVPAPVCDPDCETACRLGHAASCRDAGTARLEARDFALARELFDRGCDGDDTVACFLGASMSRKGVGVPVDATGALMDFLRACTLAHAPACAAAAEMLRKGEGSARDVEAAEDLERRACELADWMCPASGAENEPAALEPPGAAPPPSSPSTASPSPMGHVLAPSPTIRYRERYFALRFSVSAALAQVRPVSAALPVVEGAQMGFRVDTTFEGLSSFRPAGTASIAVGLTGDLEQLLDARLSLGVARALGPVDLVAFGGAGVDAVGSSAQPRMDRYRRSAEILVEAGGSVRARFGRGEASALAAWGARADGTSEFRAEVGAAYWTAGGRVLGAALRALDFEDSLVIGLALSVSWEPR